MKTRSHLKSSTSKRNRNEGTSKEKNDKSQQMGMVLSMRIKRLKNEVVRLRQNQMKEQDQSVHIKIPEWQCLTNETTQEWTTYSPGLQSALERGYQRKYTVKFFVNDVAYEARINSEGKMEQRRVDGNKGTVRKMRRYEILPLTMRESHTLVLISSNDIGHRFLNNLLPVDFQRSISMIHYCSNPQLQDDFRDAEEICRRRGIPVVPVWVFHGTTAASAFIIAAEGFKVGGVEDGCDMIHGQSYGPGIYTTSNATTAKRYGNSLVVCSVLQCICNSCRCGMNSQCISFQPPDSNVFVIRSGAHILPKYIITLSA